jgi:predicted Zn finger-like uncharacterized protein
MYTQCPHCQTCFRISEAHLKVANGKVRCGSCQEVFDATDHLFKNLTDREPITDFKQPSATPTPPPVSPTPPSRAKTEHIDLFTQTKPTTSPAKSPEEIRRERADAPDQSHFMESIVGNDRYNDLDKMGTISIPGDIDFGDSFIKFAEEKTSAAEPEKPTETRTPYEDFDSKEASATTADHDSIKDFYSQVDAQLDEDEARSQLDKDIDELLAFAKGLDLDKDLEHSATSPPAHAEKQTAKPSESDIEEVFDLQAIADFEKELEATSTGVFTAQQLQQEQTGSKPATKKAPTSKTPAKSETQPVEQTDADELPFEFEAEETQTKPEPKSKSNADIMAGLPSADEDIPLALRRSLDSLSQLPHRSLGQTLLLLLVILVLIGGLGFQVVLFRSVDLAQKFPQLIPVLSKVCDRIPCRYSGKVDVSQIKLISRDVRSHPTQPNALLISAAFVNQAPFDQPYPIIQITLYDLAGNVVASRRFTPREYLEDMYNRFLLMESGTPVHVTLAVLDPGKDAINFEFSFL